MSDTPGAGHNLSDRDLDIESYAEMVSIWEARQKLNERRAAVKERYTDRNRNFEAVEFSMRQQYKGGSGMLTIDEIISTAQNLAPGEQATMGEALQLSTEDLEAAYDEGFNALDEDSKAKLADNPYHPINQRGRYGQWRAGWVARQRKIAEEMAPADEGGEAEHLEDEDSGE